MFAQIQALTGGAPHIGELDMTAAIDTVQCVGEDTLTQICFRSDRWSRYVRSLLPSTSPPQSADPWALVYAITPGQALLLRREWYYLNRVDMSWREFYFTSLIGSGRWAGSDVMTMPTSAMFWELWVFFGYQQYLQFQQQQSPDP